MAVSGPICLSCGSLASGPVCPQVTPQGWDPVDAGTGARPGGARPGGARPGGAWPHHSLYPIPHHILPHGLFRSAGFIAGASQPQVQAVGQCGAGALTPTPTRVTPPVCADIPWDGLTLSPLGVGPQGSGHVPCTRKQGVPWLPPPVTGEPAGGGRGLGTGAESLPHVSLPEPGGVERPGFSSAFSALGQSSLSQPGGFGSPPQLRPDPGRAAAGSLGETHGGWHLENANPLTAPADAAAQAPLSRGPNACEGAGPVPVRGGESPRAVATSRALAAGEGGDLGHVVAQGEGAEPNLGWSARCQGAGPAGSRAPSLGHDRTSTCPAPSRRSAWHEPGGRGGCSPDHRHEEPQSSMLPAGGGLPSRPCRRPPLQSAMTRSARRCSASGGGPRARQVPGAEPALSGPRCHCRDGHPPASRRRRALGEL